MPTAGRLVADLYERYQARDWSGAAALLHPEVRLDMPATGERLVGREQVIALQERYPEPWGDLEVLRVLRDESSAGAAAEIEVVAPVAVFRCAAFWVARDHLLHRGVEYWVTVGGEEPPPR
jgi:hypothetical protein